MPGTEEIEERLEQEAWAARNGLDTPVYLPPAEALAEFEHRAHRDCPEPDAYDTLPPIPRGWGFGIGLLFAAGVWGALWVLLH